jgi:hydroxymethylpyrimidine pyrophosphatase-like HAD family hydrolase
LTDEQVAIFDEDLNIIRMHNYTEAYKKGYSKANGIAILADVLQLSKESIVAFGDSRNDTEMFLSAGTRVVMRQAPNDIKALASIVTRSRYSGVAEGIRRLRLHHR